MKFVSPAVDSYFIHESFAALAPKNLDAPYPQKSQKVIVVPLASHEYVSVGRRIDYFPATAEEFELQKQNLTVYIERDQYVRAVGEWFMLPNIKERTDFYPGSER